MNQNIVHLVGSPCYLVLEWGLVLFFWSIAEPISHFNIPPFSEGNSPEAAETALRYSFFHWGLHPWGIYAVIALALAFFQIQKRCTGNY